jgi:hypothetical protein
MNIKERSLGHVLRHLYILFPLQKTQTPQAIKTAIGNRYPARYAEYYQLLVHFITILNGPNRMKERGYYITGREDIISALYILDKTLLKEIRSREEQARDFYLQIKGVLTDKQNFTRRQLQHLLDIPKTTLHSKLKLLIDHGYLEITGGHKNRGYIYSLK